MPTKDTDTCTPGADVKGILRELEVPFSPDQVHWRVTVTANDRKRGQIVPYADPRAYTDRLNALFSPQGWTREYEVETMSNITRMKKGESFLSGKVFVTCTMTISGLWSHSGTGEAWADDDNGMTSADARAFKRACSCFGLGRYFKECARQAEMALDNRRQMRTRPRREKTASGTDQELVRLRMETARTVARLTARLGRVPMTTSTSASEDGGSRWNCVLPQHPGGTWTSESA